MPWIESYHPFVRISIRPLTVIKNAPNIAIFKSPSTTPFICNQNLLRDGSWSYSMRWIQRRHPFTRICSGSSSIIKNVPDFAIFNSLLTDSFIYSQNLPREGKYAYLMRWIQWYHPFCRISSGSSPVTKNVLYFSVLKSPSPGAFPAIRTPFQRVFGHIRGPEFNPQIHFPTCPLVVEESLNFVNFRVFLTQWRMASNCSMHDIPGRI